MKRITETSPVLNGGADNLPRLGQPLLGVPPCFLFVVAIVFMAGCARKAPSGGALAAADSAGPIAPFRVTDTVRYDTDDPAIWIDAADPSRSLIIGTDKGGDAGDGALYVFGLDGREQPERTVHGIKRPNNVDVAYGLTVGTERLDVAVCSERNTNSIRVFRLPDMKPVDGGGIPVFVGDTARLPMGLALYTHNGSLYAIVSRKSGPSGSYLHQYRLDGASGTVKASLVRAFGEYSGKHEIEAVAVDNELGYVYYSDEGAGVRKYYAHPDSANRQLAVLGATGFADNHEGISIYKSGGGKGFILVSDQQADQFQVFTREGTASDPHNHQRVSILKLSTIESDGNEVTSVPLPGFPQGLFVAMSDDRTFQIYRWEDLARQFEGGGESDADE